MIIFKLFYINEFVIQKFRQYSIEIKKMFLIIDKKRKKGYKLFSSKRKKLYF